MNMRLIVGLVLTASVMVAFTAEAKKASKQAATKTPSEFSTAMSFESKAIKGKVQSGSLRKIVVENDKSLDDLLGVRRHFDDRESQEGERNQTW